MSKKSQISMDELIAEFGGIRPMARTLGFKYPNIVQYWKRKGYACVWHHGRIIEAGKQANVQITRAQLLDMYEKKTSSWKKVGDVVDNLLAE